MNKILNVYKPLGATPLEVIHGLRKIYPEYSNETIAYAGRLDPLAEGVLLLMVGDATKERDKYLALEKEYEFEVLFGVETDSYDVLGLITKIETGIIVNENVNIFVNKHITTLRQPYPPYSSKAVQGKPLFQWARENRLAEIEIPTHEITINAFEKIEDKQIDQLILQKRIIESVALVSGDFRQNEIIASWNSFFSKTKNEIFPTARFTITCSSGTYVRSLVYELGRHLGCGSIALSIKRTRVGTYGIADSLHLLVPSK